jgi:hypothetical protein
MCCIKYHAWGKKRQNGWGGREAASYSLHAASLVVLNQCSNIMHKKSISGFETLRDSKFLVGYSIFLMMCELLLVHSKKSIQLQPETTKLEASS